MQTKQSLDPNAHPCAWGDSRWRPTFNKRFPNLSQCQRSSSSGSLTLFRPVLYGVDFQPSSFTRWFFILPDLLWSSFSWLFQSTTFSSKRRENEPVWKNNGTLCFRIDVKATKEFISSLWAGNQTNSLSFTTQHSPCLMQTAMSFVGVYAISIPAQNWTRYSVRPAE